MTPVNIILIVFAILFFLFLVLSMVKKPNVLMDFTFEHTDILVWGKDHLELLFEINKYRVESGLTVLVQDDDMKLLAQARTQYLINNSITKDLHKDFLKHRKPYIDIGLENISENTYYGVGSAFIDWSDNDSYTKNMLMPSWEYIGISIQENHLGKNYVSLILAK